jgi:hypothetical protein
VAKNDQSASQGSAAEPMVDAAQPGETAATAGMAPDVETVGGGFDAPMPAEATVGPTAPGAHPDPGPTLSGSYAGEQVAGAAQPDPNADPYADQRAPEASGTLPEVDPVAQAHADLNAARVAAGLQAASSEEAGDMDRSALDQPAEGQA